MASIPIIAGVKEIMKINNDTSVTLLSRDYKGLSTYGSNAVLIGGVQ